MINPDVLAHQLLLPRLVGQVPPHLVTVLFRLQERNQVDAGPHLLAGELAVELLACGCAGWRKVVGGLGE